jgi:hypothetical protein
LKYPSLSLFSRILRPQLRLVTLPVIGGQSQPLWSIALATEWREKVASSRTSATPCLSKPNVHAGGKSNSLSKTQKTKSNPKTKQNLPKEVGNKVSPNSPLVQEREMVQHLENDCLQLRATCSFHHSITQSTKTSSLPRIQTK